MVSDETVPSLRMELPAVEGHDARRFLAPVLQGVQPERGDGGRIGMPEDAEDAALLAQGFIFEIAHGPPSSGRLINPRWKEGEPKGTGKESYTASRPSDGKNPREMVGRGRELTVF